MLERLIIFLIVMCALALENYLSKRLKNVFWGGIIPFIILGFSIYIFISNTLVLEKENLFPFIVLNFIFFSSWMDGRIKHKKFQEDEVKKMKIKDL